jgi:hypothetical protein
MGALPQTINEWLGNLNATRFEGVWHAPIIILMEMRFWGV